MTRSTPAIQGCILSGKNHRGPRVGDGVETLSQIHSAFAPCPYGRSGPSITLRI
jgi:hypothetical protein